jgi:membrane associated rhomboid family serine protease
MIPLYDTVRSRTVPVVTWSLLLINVLVFLFELTLSNRQLQHLVSAYGVVPHDFLLWQHGRISLERLVLPYFSSMFLHGGWAHIIGNMLFLWIFADNVEDRQGSGTFLAFYLLCGVAAGITQTLVDPMSKVASIGASGAIAGVLGAYVLYYPGARIVSLVFLGFFFTTVAVPAVLYLGLWFVMQIFSGAASLSGYEGGVAYFAHIGGFVVGLVLAPFIKRA